MYDHSWRLDHQGGGGAPAEPAQPPPPLSDFPDGPSLAEMEMRNKIAALESSLKAIHIAAHWIDDNQWLTEENQARLDFILEESSLEPQQPFSGTIDDLPEVTKKLIAFLNGGMKDDHPNDATK